MLQALPISPTRRRLLAAGVALIGLATLPRRARGGSIAALPFPPARLLVLDADTGTILETFAEATIATGNGLPPVAATGITRRLDEELFYSEPAIRDDFLLALRVADWLPLAYGHFSRLHRLDLAERRAFLDGLADTRFDTVRAIVNGLRMICGLMYHAHPSTWAAMAYDGPHAHLPPRESEQQAHYRALTGGRA